MARLWKRIGKQVHLIFLIDNNYSILLNITLNSFFPSTTIHRYRGFLLTNKPWHNTYHILLTLVGDSSFFGPNRVIVKDVKICTYCYYVRCVTLIVWVGENALAPNRRISLTCITVGTSIQRSCNQRIGWLQ